jgi:sulfhydrogenase subunit beta (sulfur reductase)
MRILESKDFPHLLECLKTRGFSIIGPTVNQGAILYDQIQTVNDLPVGWTDEQNNGAYRLQKRHDPALFGYAVGPNSWKRFLHLPAQRLWKSSRNGNDFTIQEEGVVERKIAFLGVRPCELHAIAIQDKIFMEGRYIDTFYAARRKNVLVIAVNCSHPAATCFCASMQTGPAASGGFDLLLTEVITNNRHYFTLDSASEEGTQIANEISQKEAAESEKQESFRVTEKAAQMIRRSLETDQLKELLYRNYDNPQWDRVAQRCLSCANCTMVCPTCFCTTTEDVTDLSGDHSERWQKWDSCFNLQFSYIHGGVVRTSTKSRYRQWMTHKLATWKDQFGTSGCVGCGRCITWCPAGIDLTEESAAIRQSEKQGATK